jgi:steroid delta-isomerase-like uncharacterized protein
VGSESERLVRRFVDEVVNGGNFELLPMLFAADHVSHQPLGDHYGHDGVRITVAELRQAFSELSVSIEELITAGDHVIHRFTLTGTQSGPWLGLPPTGRTVRATGIAIDRVAAGVLAERWVLLDAVSVLRQLGGAMVLGRPTGYGQVSSGEREREVTSMT